MTCVWFFVKSHVPYGDYRVYLIDAGGRIFRGEDIEAPDAVGAISTGRIIIGEHVGCAEGFEIWGGKELIFRQFGVILSYTERKASLGN